MVKTGPQQRYRQRKEQKAAILKYRRLRAYKAVKKQMEQEKSSHSGRPTLYDKIFTNSENVEIKEPGRTIDLIKTVPLPVTKETIREKPKKPLTKKPDPYAKARKQYEAKRSIIEKEKEEKQKKFEKIQKIKEEAQKRRKKEASKYKLKNKKGQPLMKVRVNKILKKLQSGSVDQG
ncbi:uncharacterized protein MONOS_16947 [Monocercomonoides exilis]|uniref:uncharacterized protein n=1 Tax=Monocercomonoides exilis TaxID=2049356 RepID=UPI00355A163E|nr:hypothetical protein MONOS_16947 [Monocercomonoides exilis]